MLNFIQPLLYSNTISHFSSSPPLLLHFFIFSFLHPHSPASYSLPIPLLATPPYFLLPKMPFAFSLPSTSFETHPDFDAEEARHMEILRRCHLAGLFASAAEKYSELVPRAKHLYDVYLDYYDQWILAQFGRMKSDRAAPPSVRRTQLWRRDWDDIAQGRVVPSEVCFQRVGWMDGRQC